MAKRIGKRLGFRRVPEILMLPVRMTPLVWCVGGRPRVIMPGELFERLDPHGQEAILSHEFAHIRRKDHVVRLLEVVATTLFWWHPVVWWASRELRELEEQCCDATVLGTVPHGARAYATALVDTLDFLFDSPVAVPRGATAAKSPLSLARRIKMLEQSRDRRLTVRSALAVILIAAVPMAVAFAAEAEKRAPEPTAGTVVQDLDRETQPAGAKRETPKTPVSPEAREPGSGNFVVVPITTNLQRAAGSKYAEAKVFVLINGTALFNEDDTVLNVAAIDLKGLRKAMEAYLKAGMRGTTIFRVCSAPLLPRPERVDWGASGIFHLFLRDRAGAWFRDYDVEMVQHHDWKYANDWPSLVADLTTPPSEEAIQAESGVGDDQVKLYPVRTPLSRYLFGDKADCVIHIIPPLHEADAGILHTMQRCLAQLNLKKKEWVLFLWHGKGGHAGEVNQLREEFFGRHVQRDLLGFKWQAEMLWD